MLSTPIILKTPEQAKEWRRGLPATAKVGFVPTMGALHRGHGELLKRARSRCDILVLSIFVNPTQFGPNEDLAKYPRTFERDLELAASHGVDVVFAPNPEAMYSAHFSTYVEETMLSRSLCGVFRPTHFRGVTTVVLKLFNIIRPELALFGLKDAQQFFVLDRMARDLDLGVTVEGVATVRETDGLALSSRNVYLSSDERKTAPLLYRELTEAAKTGDTQSSIERLERAGFKVQYFEFRELPSFEKKDRPDSQKPTLLAAAAMLGTTRLIDNVIVNAQQLEQLGIRVQLA